MKFFKLSHNAKGKSGKIVAVTYSLKKSANVTFLENGFNIGYTNIDLLKDQDSNPDNFSTKGTQKYLCLQEDDGLQVTLYAGGMTGDFWTLDIQVDGVALAANPIKVYTDNKGNLDYNKLIK
ncbi:hypothetical protein TH53_07245 [Pedobacter lusitanus]|uniref:PLAT domain-containing protein n=1 Tax=Pedobacter lusitanus TaxID=1503925 RepID=A0A0D0GKH1_9SPHI|nr:hypothetical protein [Pedobacter lusitanus]KIO77727.1 hypothetical protein TH53_07245 [Pedobacter lusitanus]